MGELDRMIRAVGEYLDYVADTPTEEVEMRSEAAQALKNALCDIHTEEVTTTYPENIREEMHELADMIGKAIAHFISLSVRSGEYGPIEVADMMANYFKAAVILGMMTGYELGVNTPCVASKCSPDLTMLN